MQHEVLPGRVSKVANRYRPVDPTPETTTAPWIVILASACVIGLGALWGARDLEGWVGGKEGLFAQDAWMAVAGGLNTAAEQTGVASARALVDGWVAPLQHTAPVLARPDPVIDPDVEPIASLAESQDTDAVDTDLPPGARWVGPADPRSPQVKRVALIGASSMQYYLGVELERRLEAEYPGVSVHRLGKLGTGLGRQDVFDWPKAVADILSTHKPDVVVIQLGGNDAQPITVGGKRVPFGQDAWDAAYSERLAGLIAQIREAGATPVFLGMPVMRDAGFSGRMERMNTVTAKAAAEGGARYIGTWDLVSDHAGAYQAEVAYDGRRGRMRLQDGVHYSRLGAQYLADRLLDRLEREVPLVPPGEDAVHVRLVADGGIAHAWVPRQVPDAGLPGVVLKVPATGGELWLDEAHRTLPGTLRDRIVVALPALEGVVLPRGGEEGLMLTSEGQAWLRGALPLSAIEDEIRVVGVDGLGAALGSE